MENDMLRGFIGLDCFRVLFALNAKTKGYMHKR